MTLAELGLTPARDPPRSGMGSRHDRRDALRRKSPNAIARTPMNHAVRPTAEQSHTTRAADRMGDAPSRSKRSSVVAAGIVGATKRFELGRRW
jgi:hypothetical protein